MSVLEIVLMGVALSMDAVAVGLTNGMAEPRMRMLKALLIAATFGFFQFFMPCVGYYGSSVFVSFVQKIAPYLSFALLALIGGKMLWEGSHGEENPKERYLLSREKTLGVGKLVVQAFATSIDALAVGVSLLAQESSAGLPFPVVVCALVIGAVTFFLSYTAVALGSRIGNKLSAYAEMAGGAILVLIGCKFLLEGIISP